jgi:hypothetical protein
LNFDNCAQTAGLGFPHNGQWLDVISGEVVAVTGFWRDFILPPWEAVVLAPLPLK